MKESKSSLIHEKFNEALDLDPFIDKVKGVAGRILPGAKKRRDAAAKAKETQANALASIFKAQPHRKLYGDERKDARAKELGVDRKTGKPRDDSGYHGANQPVPSIDPELLDDSNAKLMESRYKDPGEIADKIEKRQMGLYTAEDEELSPGGVVSPENRSKTTVYKHGKKVYDSDTATPAERKAYAKKSAESRKLTKDRTTRKGAFRARRPAGSGQVRPLVATKKKSSKKK